MTLPTTMQAIEMNGAGGPEVLRGGQRAIPQPGAGQVLVKVAYAGVNGPDLMQRKGLYPAPKGASDLLGLEIAGEVVAVGADTRRFTVGDTLCGLTNGGGYAEYCAILADHCLPIPAGVTVAQAASLPEAFFTVWSNVFMGAGLKAGETFLVHGGAGGLGTAAIQLGKAFGARVIAIDHPADRGQSRERADEHVLYLCRGQAARRRRGRRVRRRRRDLRHQRRREEPSCRR